LLDAEKGKLVALDKSYVQMPYRLFIRGFNNFYVKDYLRKKCCITAKQYLMFYFKQIVTEIRKLKEN